MCFWYLCVCVCVYVETNRASLPVGFCVCVAGVCVYACVSVCVRVCMCACMW